MKKYDKQFWEKFSQDIENDAEDILLESAKRMESASDIKSVDSLLKDATFLTFFKDFLASIKICSDLQPISQKDSLKITELIYGHTNFEKIKVMDEEFELNEIDKQYINLCVQRMFLGLAVKKTYAHSHHIIM